MTTPARWLVAGVCLLAVLTPACASPEAGRLTGRATATPQADGQPPSVAPGVDLGFVDQPEVGRVWEYLEHLTVTIGSRSAGTQAERDAAEYLAARLRSFGYETEIEGFDFEVLLDESTLVLGGEVDLEVFILQGTPNAEASGRLTYAGVGRADEVAAADVRGKIAIIDRGDVPFADKVRHAQSAGALGVIIVNHQEGVFRGTLGEFEPSIPVLGTALESRETLLRAAESGAPLQMSAQVTSRRDRSQNVVAQRGEECRFYLGGHYDSVPEGPGANDNASGVAVVLELARVRPIDGLCVIAFGAEEVGLWGSQAYVGRHLAGGAHFMLNVDMAGKLADPIIVGDGALTRSILSILSREGERPQLRAGVFPPFASSDHVSFSAVGVPAVTLTSGDDEFIHTAQDDIANVDLESLGVMLEAADRALLGLVEQAMR